MRLLTEYTKKRTKYFGRTMNCAFAAILLEIMHKLFPKAIWLNPIILTLMMLTVVFGVRYLALVFTEKRGDGNVKRKI